MWRAVWPCRLEENNVCKETWEIYILKCIIYFLYFFSKWQCHKNFGHFFISWIKPTWPMINRLKWFCWKILFREDFQISSKNSTPRIVSHRGVNFFISENLRENESFSKIILACLLGTYSKWVPFLKKKWEKILVTLPLEEWFFTLLLTNWHYTHDKFIQKIISFIVGPNFRSLGIFWLAAVVCIIIGWSTKSTFCDTKNWKTFFGWIC